MSYPVLSTELVLEAPQRISDSGGGVAINWTEVGTVWAELESVGARETISGGRESARVTHKITVRSAPPESPRRPQPECRFRAGSRVFAIRGVSEADARRQYLTCWAEEGAFS